MSSRTPSGTLTDLLVKTKVIWVGLKCSSPRDIATECGMRLALDPRSQRYLWNRLLHILQSRTKLLGFGCLVGIFPSIIALTSSETIMTLCSDIGKLCDTMSFTYFFMVRESFIASLSGILIVILSKHRLIYLSAHRSMFLLVSFSEWIWCVL